MSSWKYVDYRQRMSDLPPTSELAARIRDGETLKDVARSVRLDPQGLANRLRSAGYMPTGEAERDYRSRLMKEHLSSKLQTYSLPWMREAICAQTDPDAFYPEKGGSTAEAKRVCMGCPVRGACLEYALTNNERFGIFGGKSERERRKLLKERAA